MGCLKLENIAPKEEAKILKIAFSKSRKCRPTQFFSKKTVLDYYPFGMQKKARTLTEMAFYDKYRYGFQRQEKDDEVKGEGNSLNYKYRMHDTRLGRFFAVDPLTPSYPELTPYQFAANQVIHGVELEGLENADYFSPSHQSSYSEASQESGGPVLMLSPEARAAEIEEAFDDVKLAVVTGAVLAFDIAFLGGTLTRIYGLYHLGNAHDYSMKAERARQSGNEVQADYWDAMAGSSLVEGLLTVVPITVVTKPVARVLNAAGTRLNIKTTSIRFSQSSVNGSQEIAESMNKKGWIGDPIDVVKMEDGIFTTIDNTRLKAARHTGVNIKVNTHSYSDALPDNMLNRFQNKKTGEYATTWGGAVENRIANQNAGFRNNAGSTGSYNIPKDKKVQ